MTNVLNFPDRTKKNSGHETIAELAHERRMLWNTHIPGLKASKENPSAFLKFD